MRHLLLSILLISLFGACSQPSKPNAPEPAKPATPAVNADSAGMAESLHAFFKWYGETGEQLINKIDFVDTKGKHPKLMEEVLKQYLAEFEKTGTVSKAFLEDETKYYRACAELWKNENSDEMYSGFEADRYYCQQDGDVTEFLKAGVTYKMEGDHAVVQLMLDPNGPNGGPRSFEMKQENGKWLLSKVSCDTGVKY